MLNVIIRLGFFFHILYLTQMSIEDQEPLDRIFNDELVKTKKEEYVKSDIARTNVDSQTHKDSQEDLTSEVNLPLL